MGVLYICTCVCVCDGGDEGGQLSSVLEVGGGERNEAVIQGY